MNYALILAAGSSTRFGGNKLFSTLWGMPVLQHVLLLCETAKEIDSVYVAYNKNDKKSVAELCKKVLTKPFALVEGGSTRFVSSMKLARQAYKKVRNPSKDLFVFLNGANPLTTQDEIQTCIKACNKGVIAAGVGRPVTSTLRRIKKEQSPGVYVVDDDVERINTFEMQTPQVVNAYEYIDTVEMIRAMGKTKNVFTDDLGIMGYSEKKTLIVLANEYNRKITTRADLDMMNGLISSIGIGEDSHELIRSQKPLILGGVKIPSELSFEADSDGDVVMHAIANAFSSALGGGSLGTFATNMCEDGVTDSREYVKVVLKKQKKNYLRVAHLSLSIEGRYPKIDERAPEMREALAALLEMPVERIGITATTGKSHSSYGKGTALKCTALILLRHV